MSIATIQVDHRLYEFPSIVVSGYCGDCKIILQEIAWRGKSCIAFWCSRSSSLEFLGCGRLLQDGMRVEPYPGLITREG